LFAIVDPIFQSLGLNACAHVNFVNFTTLAQPTPVHKGSRDSYNVVK
jgi:hypothetical protein